MSYKPLSRKSELVDQSVGNETLIYDLRINKALCMNETSALVYELADGNRTVAEISELMTIKLKDLVGEELIYLALSELKKNNLLENESKLTENFGGLSRREIIKKVGLASMVTLPVISGLLAPNSATAASGLQALFSSCTSSAQCQSGNCTTAGYSVCCAPGVNPFADSLSICSNTGECASLGNNCCRGPYQNLGPAGCGGAGVLCAC